MNGTIDARLGKMALPTLRPLAVEVDPEEKARMVKAESYGMPFLPRIRRGTFIRFLCLRCGLDFSVRADAAANRARAAEQLVRIEALKKLAARGKMDGVTAWVEDFLESGEKLIIFAYHVDIVQDLARRFNAPAIYGAVDLTARQSAVDKFQNDPNCKVIVLNLQAGGVGLTLTAASNVAFVELGWTPGLHDQAEDRCHRIGQASQVTAWYLLGEQTIDEEIQALIGSVGNVPLDPVRSGAADALPPPATPIISKAGDIWELGDHRLICGDATIPGVFERLFASLPARKQASLVLTDPPYGVSYESASGKHAKLKGDEKTGDDLVRKLLIPTFRNAVDNANETAAFYIWHASSSAETTVQLGRRSKADWRSPKPSMRVQFPPPLPNL